MSKLTSKFWAWKESFDNQDFRLGDSIIPKIKSGLVSPNENSENEYLGINNFPWVIKTEEEKIVSIHYIDTFFDLLREDLWELELTQFTKVVDEVLTPVDQNYKGKVFYVLFRDFYVSSAGLVDKTVK
ncbi:hypothetical protein [Aquimarina mytili]|uniref:Uncharacterized protein n=1 Tax=Aquimarina mytili TaxID=874423 RepID=A0A937DBT3_9FLAO|nr:hypothetical protein [Aquimarina mytili]MBL0684176.1 hypothetical protein [Aquimarina mytili]